MYPTLHDKETIKTTYPSDEDVSVTDSYNINKKNRVMNKAALESCTQTHNGSLPIIKQNM